MTNTRNHDLKTLIDQGRYFWGHARCFTTKRRFTEIVFDHVEYAPDDEYQPWLELYGLIKNIGGHIVISNNIYKTRYTKTFLMKVDDLFYEIHSGPGKSFIHMLTFGGVFSKLHLLWNEN